MGCRINRKSALMRQPRLYSKVKSNGNFLAISLIIILTPSENVNTNLVLLKESIFPRKKVKPRA